MQSPFRILAVGVFSLVLLSIVILSSAALQIRHHSRYGHFFPIGLHADVTFPDCAAGSGITTCIDAHLTNFGLLPAVVEQCKFTSAPVRERGAPYRLERLHGATGSWETVLDAEACGHPALQRKLWPGQKVSIGSGPVPADDEADKGTMRLVIESNGRAYPTGPFMFLTMRKAR